MAAKSFQPENGKKVGGRDGRPIVAAFYLL